MINIKIDTKQLTFEIPKDLLSPARCVLFERYVQNIGGKDDFNVSWIDEGGSPPKPMQVDTHSLNEIPDSLPCELFRTKITVYNSAHNQHIKLVTITVHYTT